MIKEEIETIKNIIIQEIEKNNLKVEKIILFGSRARGDFREDSDWDFYVIVNKEIDFLKKKKIITQIKRKLAEYNILSDILIQSVNFLDEKKDDVGYLIYYVLKDGVEIL